VPRRLAAPTRGQRLAHARRRHPIKVDFLWRREGLAIETDAFGTHGGRQAFGSDRFRDQRLRLAGFKPLRFTRRQIFREPAWVQGTVATLYARLPRAAR
jgi:very-short-patch-repair endonuclease